MSPNRLPSLRFASLLVMRQSTPKQLVELQERAGLSQGHLSKLSRHQVADVQVGTSLRLAQAMNLSYATFSQEIFGVPPIESLVNEPLPCSAIQVGEMFRSWRGLANLSLRKFSELIPVMIKAPSLSPRGASYFPLEEDCSVSHTTIKRIESGECRQISIDSLYAAALALDLLYWRTNQRPFPETENNELCENHRQWTAAALWHLTQVSSEDIDPARPAGRWPFWTYSTTNHLSGKMSYKVGDKIIVTKMFKVTLATQTVINLPAGTIGHIEEIDTAKDGTILFTLGCYPETTDLRVGFLSEEKHLREHTGLFDSTQVTPTPETDWYDDDMPGFFRKDGVYLMTPRPDADGAIDDDEWMDDQYLLYQRKAWTPWKFEIRFHQYSFSMVDEIEGVFRTTWRDNHDVEQLTLMVKGSDQVLAQFQVTKTGKVHTFSYIPIEVELSPRNKLVTIWPLITIDREKDGERFEINPIDYE